MSHPMEIFDKIFRKDKTRNALVANIEDIKRPSEPHFCLPGFKRWCEDHSKYNKIIIEAPYDRMVA